MNTDLFFNTSQIQQTGCEQKITAGSRDGQAAAGAGERASGNQGSADFNSILENIRDTHGHGQPASGKTKNDLETIPLELQTALEPDELKGMIAGMMDKDPAINLSLDDDPDNQAILRELLKQLRKDLLTPPTDPATDAGSTKNDAIQPGLLQQVILNDGDEILRELIGDQYQNNMKSGPAPGPAGSGAAEPVLIWTGLEAEKPEAGVGLHSNDRVQTDQALNDLSTGGGDASAKGGLSEFMGPETSEMTKSGPELPEIKITDPNGNGEWLNQTNGKSQASQTPGGENGNESHRADTQSRVIMMGDVKTDGPMIQTRLDFDSLGNQAKEGALMPQNFSAESDSMPKETPVSIPNHTAIQSEEEVKAFTRTMDTAQKAAPKDTVGQIVEKAVISLKSGQSEARIELKPEFLGNVRMQIATENHQVTVKIMAELPVVKEIIENNLNQLKLDLQNQGLEVDKVDVFVADDSRGQHKKHGNMSGEASGAGDDIENDEDSDVRIIDAGRRLTGNLTDEGVDYFA